MHSVKWSDCRKPVITIFCFYYVFFTLSQALPRQWLVTQFCISTTPQIVKQLGLEYFLILFARQKSYYPSYSYRIYFPNSVVLDWAYPEQEFLFDKQLYARLFCEYMWRQESSNSLKVAAARYIARKFNSANSHPVAVECLEAIHRVPPVGSEFAPPVVRQMYIYRVTPQDLASN
ncbi:MAG: hypothetical protein P4L53_03140 [Candidatus Obscuribacterales bacterium]|nr:hypothetical protein [Candidatus Obscuribacterales bacterium]